MMKRKYISIILQISTIVLIINFLVSQTSWMMQYTNTFVNESIIQLQSIVINNNTTGTLQQQIQQSPSFSRRFQKVNRNNNNDGTTGSIQVETTISNNTTNHNHTEHSTSTNTANDSGSTDDTTTNTTIINDDDGFAACLLIMDDNHNLIEWIAYHYYVLPLKYLIIAVDPRSTTDPYIITQRYTKLLHTSNITNHLPKLHIQLWYNESIYISNVNTSVYEQSIKDKAKMIKNLKRNTNDTKLNHRNNFLTIHSIQHRYRQGYFYKYCQQYHTQYNNNNANTNRSSNWIIFIDTDEYIMINYNTTQTLINQYNTNITTRTAAAAAAHAFTSNPNSNTTTFNHTLSTNISVSIPPIHEYGSVWKFLHNTTYQHLFFPYFVKQQQQRIAQQHGLLPTLLPNDTPCIQIPRRRFGSVIIDTATSTSIATTLDSTDNKNLSMFPIRSNLSTQIFFYHSSITDFTQNGLSKSMIHMNYTIVKDNNNNNNNNDNNSNTTTTSTSTTKSNAHRPNLDYCTKRNLFIPSNEQVFIIHHYLGSLQQYMFRNDTRRSNERFQKTANLRDGYNNDMSSWLDGFISMVGIDIATMLLQNAGQI